MSTYRQWLQAVSIGHDAWAYEARLVLRLRSYTPDTMLAEVRSNGLPASDKAHLCDVIQAMARAYDARTAPYMPITDADWIDLGNGGHMRREHKMPSDTADSGVRFFA